MTVSKFKIQGHQVIAWRYVTVLAMFQFHVYILFSGHTHTHTKHENKFLIYPGSATAANCALETKTSLSFVLMDIQPSTVVTDVYQIIGNYGKEE